MWTNYKGINKKYGNVFKYNNQLQINQAKGQKDNQSPPVKIHIDLKIYLTDFLEHSVQLIYVYKWIFIN